jgi:hypothetical protein
MTMLDWIVGIPLCIIWVIVSRGKTGRREIE